MAVFVGTDIVSTTRIKNSITELGDAFLKRIYTDEEISYCESRRMSKFQSYAARFAAKEAVFKAISPDNINGISWLDIEVTRKDTGKPMIKLAGTIKKLAANMSISDENIDISLSHDENFAIAMVAIEK